MCGSPWPQGDVRGKWPGGRGELGRVGGRMRGSNWCIGDPQMLSMLQTRAPGTRLPPRQHPRPSCCLLAACPSAGAAPARPHCRGESTGTIAAGTGGSEVAAECVAVHLVVDRSAPAQTNCTRGTPQVSGFATSSGFAIPKTEICARLNTYGLRPWNQSINQSINQCRVLRGGRVCAPL